MISKSTRQAVAGDIGRKKNRDDDPFGRCGDFTRQYVQDSIDGLEFERMIYLVVVYAVVTQIYLGNACNRPGCCLAKHPAGGYDATQRDIRIYSA